MPSASALRLTAASHRGELLRLLGGITIIDDSYNSSPSALKRALELVAATGVRPQDRGPRRDARARRACWPSAPGVRSAAAQSGLSILIAVGGDPRDRSRTPRLPAACRSSACITSRPSRTPRNSPCNSCGPVTSCSSRGRAESGRITWWNSSDGVCLRVLPPLPVHLLAGPQRDALHHVQNGRREPDGASPSGRSSARG